MTNRRQQPRAVIKPGDPERATISVEVAPPFHPPMDRSGHLAGALALFAMAIALFLILLVMIAASNA